MPETDDGYKLAMGGHAHRLAKHSMGRRLPDGSYQAEWVSQLRAAVELHIVEIHPRLPDIERAGGVIVKREVGSGTERRMEFYVAKAPAVAGFERAVTDALVIRPPGDGPMAWVPPPAVDRVAA